MEAIKVYETLCPHDWVTPKDPRRDEIIASMQAIQYADSDEDAAKIIEWWGWEDSPVSCVEFCRKARGLFNATVI